MHKLLFIFIATFFIVGGMCNCTKTTSSATSELQILDVSPDTIAQSMYLNNKLYASNVGYGQDSNTLTVGPGNYNIRISPAGIDNNIDFSPNHNYLMFLVNVNGAIQPEVIQNNYAYLGVDTSAFRFFDFSSTYPAIEIGLSSDTTTTDSTYIWYTNRYFNDQYVNPNYANFTVVPSGGYYLKLILQDTTLVPKVLDSLHVTFNSRVFYTIYTRGFEDSSHVPPFYIDTTIRH